MSFLQKILKRASSVPSRTDEPIASVPSVCTINEMDTSTNGPLPSCGVDGGGVGASGDGSGGTMVRRSTSGITPSSTDESVKCSTTTSTTTPPSSSGGGGTTIIVAASTSSGSSSMAGGPPPMASTTSEISASSLLPHLPNITPVRGHQNYQGWL